MMCVYLYCFDGELGSDIHRARHYIGYAADVAARDALHQAGQGAAITRAAVARGFALRLARVWPGADRAWERTLKQYKSAKRLCPICSGPIALTRMPSMAAQTELAFEIAPWEQPDYTPPPAAADWYEISMQRRWRACTRRRQ